MNRTEKPNLKESKVAKEAKQPEKQTETKKV
jgi:hypothetical protein